ncbi:2-oxo-4-hydroxy-4-carboxy-5-ureidoimidazoline decarboxylase [Marinobacterium rhizophilum]|uniref:2-oxo-4-hydroxy-4-carboxy-5-ureidoimidazoline decarboxylase n=1 Tax=Marinobacterium rhizophilum TaxID=420402 RepID=A0ABY5HG28_9GAMM|nr:2-oxo-4-hydroxy-4-carboxy-5-ureidoimidazoline decarboxylase [Marinobacterium rhizophilum]UTW11079.1 2-oxo-4-hydroxy-4-carboxy-5-ureidoimidazoline decarboxylase [Marinobacterium rhizophilum]
MSPFKTCTPSTLSRDAFIQLLGDIYEHSAWVAEQTFDQARAENRMAELDSVESLHGLMAAQLMQASHEAQLALINAHPDLAGKAAVRGELTAASTSEQAGAGISECNAEEFARFTELNAAYKDRFKFPFIMAVKGSNRHQILAAFEERIHNSPEQEFARALAEINNIALFRLQTL